jgi:GT2 family glycosyltransferase
MLLRNDKQKPITIIFQGKKSVVYPGQTIEGPIQLTIYGLTQITNTTSVVARFVEQAPRVSPYKELNIKEIDSALDFVKSYNKISLPSVAICILSKDSYHLISDCINSIMKLVKYPNTKIYIFDTGTTDQKTLEFYNKTQLHSTIPVQVIPVGEYHFSKNYNHGLKLVNADFFLIQNNDTVALNDYVTRLVHLAVTKKVGACGPRMLYKDGLIQHDGQVLYDHQNKTFGSPTHVNLKRNVADVNDGIRPADGITCAGMFVKSSVYWEAGGLNEVYHDIFQDVELNIKIRMNGHAIICDRNALIHHYDNTSRNNFWANNVEKLRLKHLDYNYLFGRFGNELRYIDRPRKKFSIVTLVNNETQYTDFLNDLKEQDCDFDFEIITLPNFNGEYEGCATALNVGWSLAESEYVIMCHQDLRVPKNWLSGIYERIREFIINDIKFGVLGMAGSWVNEKESDGVVYLSDNLTKTTKFTEVQCLDELCLIVKNDGELRFDEVNFKHYHCYGSDLCLNYISHGYRNFAINCPCVHISDGFKNLVMPDHLNMFIKNSLILHRKWRDTVPNFRNTTAKFSKLENSILFYVADELNKRGIPLQKHIVMAE